MIKYIKNKLKNFIQSLFINNGYIIVKLDSNFFYNSAMSLMLTKHKLSIKKREYLENDFLSFCINSYPNSYSQRGQDLFALYINSKINKNLRSNYCIEFGAGNGIYLSNTKILSEKKYKSILIEPSKKMYKKLIKNRNDDICINALIKDCNDDSEYISFDEAGLFSKKSSLKIQKENINIFKNKFSKKTLVKAEYLNEILLKKLPQINNFAYLSIDTEGNELEILKTIDFQKYTFNCLTIECNFLSDKRIAIINFMHNNGYKVIFEKDVTITGVDLWFYRNIIKLM